MESFVSIKRVSELLSLPKFNRETFFGQMSDFVDEENEDLTIGKENCWFKISSVDGACLKVS